MIRRVEEERIAMTVPCTSCGEPLHHHDPECRHCGTLAPPPQAGSSVFGGEPVADEPHHAFGSDQTNVEPWTIPIREARVAPGGAPWSESGPLRAVTVGLVALAVLVGAIGFGAGALVGDGGPDEGSNGAGRDEVAVAGDRVDADATATTVDEPATSTSSTNTTSTPTTTTTTSTSTSATTAAPTASSVPTLASSFRSGWVAQLTSVPVSAGTAALEESFAAVRADAPSAVVTRSDEWPAMEGGFWVVVAPGPFGSEDSVRAFCASTGRSSDGCLPRLLADRR